MRNEESKHKTEGGSHLISSNSPVIEPIDKKLFKSCLSLKNPRKENSELPDLNKFNSEGMSMGKKFKTSVVNNPNLREENILFKGENGNQEVF
jgi:hypothetical protein